MLKTLTLKNFRKHADRVVTFSDGLNALKGPNENGKSSIFEAIWYALYGSSAIKATLDDIATWGTSPSSVRVVLEFVVNGISGSVSRSKSSANLVYGDITATGHTAVTEAVERIFGASAKIAGNLYGVSQGDIKGALVGGSGVSNALLDTLANFKELDELIVRFQDTYTTGNTKNLRDELNTLVIGEEPQPPVLADTAELEEKIAALSEEAKAEAFKSAAAAKVSAAVSKLESEIQSKDSKSLRLQELEKTRGRAAQLAEELAALDKQVLEESETLAELSELRSAITLVFGCGNELEVSTEEPCKTELLEAQQVVLNLTSARREAESSLRSHKAGVVLCDRCKVELDSKAEHIAALEKSISSIITELKVADVKYKVVNTSYHNQLQAFNNYQTLHKHPEILHLVTITDGVATVHIGHLPQKLKNLQLSIQTAQRKIKEVSTEATKQRVLDIERDLLSKEDLSTSEIHEKISGLKEELAGLNSDRKGVAVELREAKERLQSVKSNNQLLMRLYDSEFKTYNAKVDRDVYLRTQLAEIDQNNHILKKLRDAKPHLSGVLWGAVLSDVSSIFTSMRGEPSLITYDGKFHCNGKLVETSLSESTKDILGLSLRMSLIKLFLPNVSWLLLDEPASACEASREEALISAVATAGFNQVLMISHRDIIDSVANNLIEV